MSSFPIQIERELNSIVNATLKALPGDPWADMGERALRMSSSLPAFTALEVAFEKEKDLCVSPVRSSISVSSSIASLAYSE